MTTITAHTPTITYTAKEAAAKLRKALRAEFSGATFSVRSGHGWLRVVWTDGPPVDAVRAIADRFEGERVTDPLRGGLDPVGPVMERVDGVLTAVVYCTAGVLLERETSSRV